MTNINKQFVLSIESSPKLLSLALLNKNKIIKVKSFNLENQLDDKDNMFIYLKSFIKNTQLNLNDIKSLYVGCGPGSFTNIRKILSFAIGLKVSILSCNKNKNIFVAGINSLSAIAYQFFLKTNYTKTKFFLPTIDTKCGDYYMQLFSKQLNDFKSIKPLSPIVCITPKKVEQFLKEYTNENSHVTILGLENSNLNKLKFDFKNYDIPSAYLIANMGLDIEKQEKENKKLLIDKSLYNLNLIPIYAKNPNIHKK